MDGLESYRILGGKKAEEKEAKPTWSIYSEATSLPCRISEGYEI